MRIRVKVIPGASRESLEWLEKDLLKITVRAAPEKGKANKAVISLLAKTLGLEKNAVTVVSGQTSPLKTIELENINLSALKQSLK